MLKPPELLKGIVFDEPFFDAVIARAGGHRLTDKYPPPPKTKHADYCRRGFLIELKILMSDPLDAAERQARVQKFIGEKFTRGEIRPSPSGQVIFTKEQSQQFWERVMGLSVKDRLEAAAVQIRETKTFVPGSWSGAAIIVNSAGSSFDWQSFCQLAHAYHDRFEELNGVFALHGVPIPANGNDMIAFGIRSKNGNWPEVNELGTLLDASIREEISARTGRFA